MPPPALLAGGAVVALVALVLAYGVGRLMRGRVPLEAADPIRTDPHGAADDVHRLLRRHRDMAQAIEAGIYRLRSRYGDPGLSAELRRLEGLAAQLRSDLGYTAQAVDQTVDELSRRQPPAGP